MPKCGVARAGELGQAPIRPCQLAQPRLSLCDEGPSQHAPNEARPRTAAGAVPDAIEVQERRHRPVAGRVARDGSRRQLPILLARLQRPSALAPREEAPAPVRARLARASTVSGRIPLGPGQLHVPVPHRASPAAERLWHTACVAQTSPPVVATADHRIQTETGLVPVDLPLLRAGRSRRSERLPPTAAPGRPRALERRGQAALQVFEGMKERPIRK